MALNQILHDEQIAMMNYASAVGLAEIHRHRSEIARLAGRLACFAYPHRPYLAPLQAGLRAAIARWENEGGLPAAGWG